MFHDTYGYCAHGVGPETIVAPEGWQERLVRVEVEDAVGLCLEVHDLVLSKAVAGRAKDLEFVREAIAHALVRREVLQERVSACYRSRRASALAERP